MEISLYRKLFAVVITDDTPKSNNKRIFICHESHSWRIQVLVDWVFLRRGAVKLIQDRLKYITSVSL